jgi:hypothetical protein
MNVVSAIDTMTDHFYTFDHPQIGDDAWEHEEAEHLAATSGPAAHS